MTNAARQRDAGDKHARRRNPDRSEHRREHADKDERRAPDDGERKEARDVGRPHGPLAFGRGPVARCLYASSSNGSRACRASSVSSARLRSRPPA